MFLRNWGCIQVRVVTLVEVTMEFVVPSSDWDARAIVSVRLWFDCKPPELSTLVPVKRNKLVTA